VTVGRAADEARRPASPLTGTIASELFKGDSERASVGRVVARVDVATR
jgi:hypothetical protein